MARWTAGKVWQGRVAVGLCLLAAPVLLGGCVDTTAEVAPAPEQHRQFVLREGANLAQASIAFVSLEGAPSSATAKFRKILEAQARSHDIAIVEPSKARYLVRGYLSADQSSDGASIEYVWDVFTADKQRAQRLNDVLDVPGAGDDPWTMVGEAALTSVAAKSCDDLAAYLSNTPEAVAVVPAAASGPKTAAAAPLAYAASQ